ncbi:MAG: metallophosphoesterase [Oscillospiraceae bacterium]|nr:metallophosphoesterase [Oscillospiraceae bacterium]
MKKKILAVTVAVFMMLPLFSTAALSLSGEGYETVAHWVFSDEPEYSSGSLQDNDLVILDQSENGNYLKLMTQKIAPGQTAANSLSFSDNVLLGSEGPLGTASRSIKFDPNNNLGAYFATAAGELDTEEFLEGYTFEIFFSVGQSNQWAAILGKRGTPNSAYDIRTTWSSELDGSSQGSFNTGGGNEYVGGDYNTNQSNTANRVKGDLQLTFNNTKTKTHDPRTYHPINNNTNYQACLWSDSQGITRDRLHYAVIRNDGLHTVLYLNGLPVLRSDNHNTQPGLDMLDGLGWVIGANYSYLNGTALNAGATNWNSTSPNGLTQEQFLAREAAGDFASAQFRGEIQEIRMTKGFRPDSDLLVPNNAGIIPDEVYTSHLGNNDDAEFLAKPENYNFVFIPDTQYYVQYKRGADGGSLILSTMLEWIRDNKDNYNILGASHLGDITENNSSPRGDPEWAAASKSYEILDNANVPYTVLPGNHDWRASFLANFPESRVKGDKGEHYKFATSATRIIDPATGSLTTAAGGHSSYMIVRGGSYDYLILSTGGPNSGSSSIGGTTGAQGNELNWCRAVLRTYSDLPTIVLEHTAANTVRNNLIHPFPQVFMHVWGHISGSYAEWRTGGDNPGFWAVQIDYQSDVYGGNGWLDVFEFDEAEKTITMRTFSPWVERKLTESTLDSDWWKSLPLQDQKIYPFDIKNLTRYTDDSSALIGYRSPASGGNSGFRTNEKPNSSTPGVLSFDFAARFTTLGAKALKDSLSEISLLLADVNTVLSKPRGTNMTANLWANALSAFVPRLEAFEAAYQNEVYLDNTGVLIIDGITFTAADITNWSVNVRNIYNLLSAITG